MLPVKTGLIGAAFVAGLLPLTGLMQAAALDSADPLAKAESHYAAFGTNRIHYLTLGQGKQTVVFVHCWAGRAEFWRTQVPALETRARLILVDLPGHGKSDKPRVPYTLPFFAQAVLAVLKDAKVDRATLVGHSMGVAVIASVYRAAPEKVAALVAVDGSLRRGAFKAEEAEAFMAPFRAADYREHTTRFVGSLFPVPGTEALRDRVLADMLQTPQYVMVGAMEGMFAPGQSDWDPSPVKVPLLVLNARNAIWTAEDETHMRSVSTQVEYRTIEGVGHWLMFEKPAEFNAALLEMLRAHQLVAN